MNGTNTLLGPGSGDAAVLRVKGTRRALALAIDGPGPARVGALDPYLAGASAVLEGALNVACTGATPIGITDCLNFGSPENPDAMWQLVRAITGLADACAELGVPVTGGNVSLYNGSDEAGRVDATINPTPVVGVLGVIDDVTRATRSGWSAPGRAVYLLGTTAEELSGSVWADVVHGHLGGLPPKVDLTAERRLAEVLVNASRDQIVEAAHDVSAGGLVQTLVDSCLRFGVGARVDLGELCRRDGVDLATALFAESGARAVVAVPRSQEVHLQDLCTARGVPLLRIGTTDDTGPESLDGRPVLDIADVGTFSLDELREVAEATLPARFG